MSVIGTAMRDDPASGLRPSGAAPLRRLPERRVSERRVLVLLSAGILFAAIFVVRELVSGRGDALSLLYVIPVALLALELGTRAGVIAAIVTIAATGAWMATESTGLGLTALLVRALIFLSVAIIVGRFSDRMRVHSAREERLLRSGLDLARLDESEDLLPLLADYVQRMVHASSVGVELEGESAIVRGQIGGERLRVPIISRDATTGWIELTAGADRRFSPEDRLTIEAIALQAAVAGENRRLLAAEREHAALRAEIERMRKRLGDQLRNASQVIEHHEQERRGIARRLHDEAAQAMAGALLTVGLLERGVDAEMSRPQLEDVRQQVKACIVDLRHIAGSLRPPALDEMGLAMALERFAEIEDERGMRSVAFSLGPLPERLPPDVETATYRAIEDMLRTLDGAGSIEVSLDADEDAVRIVLGAQPDLSAVALDGRLEPGQVHVDLLATQARVELIGGSLQVGQMPTGGKRIQVEIPFAPEGD